METVGIKVQLMTAFERVYPVILSYLGEDDIVRYDDAYGRVPAKSAANS